MYTPQWNLDQMVYDRQNEFLREAELNRKIKLGQAEVLGFTALQRPLRWIARQMSALVSRMQRRAEVVSTSIQHPASDCATC